MNRRYLIPTWVLVLVALAAFLALVLMPEPATAAVLDTSPPDPATPSWLDWAVLVVVVLAGAAALVPLIRLGRD